MFASILYFLQILTKPVMNTNKVDTHKDATGSLQRVDKAKDTIQSKKHQIDENVELEIRGLEAYLNHAMDNIKSIKRATSYVQPVSVKTKCHNDIEIDFKNCRGLYSAEQWQKWKTEALGVIAKIKDKGVKHIHSLVSNLKKVLYAKKGDLNEVQEEWRAIHDIVKKTIGEMMSYILFGLYKEITLISITYKPLVVAKRTYIPFGKATHIVSQPVCRIPTLMIQPHKQLDDFSDVCRESLKKHQHYAKIVRILRTSIAWTVDDFRVYLMQKHRNTQDELHLGEVEKRADTAVTKALMEYCNRTEKEIKDSFTTDHSVLLKKCFDEFMKILESVRKTAMTELLAVSALFFGQFPVLLLL